MLKSDDRAHDACVAQDRRQRGQPFVGGLHGEDRRQKRCKGAEYNVQRAVGRQEICNKAPHKQARCGGGKQKGQDAQRLGKAKLHRPIGHAEDGGKVAEDGVQRPYDTG
ncbi:hypothetical protein SDC9_204873 [bioreactor metagenome]|uniref:Uncharacterized protein n=1 Tax=bioreactor metagenome TaxID=1076179 RepID=A0A645J392_9ZZZZ